MITVIKILGVLQIIAGTFGICVTVFSGFDARVYTAPFDLVCGIGVFNLKEWGRKLTIILATVALVLRVATGIYIMSFKYFTNWLIILSFIFLSAIIFFFTREKVKLIFTQNINTPYNQAAQ